MLMSLKPVATQVGQTTEHEVAARYNLYGAFKVLVTGEGVTGEVVPPEKPPESQGRARSRRMDKIKVRFTVAADALPGVRDFRIATPQGVSTVGQLVVGRDPVVSETGKNDSLQAAQAIDVPATVCGAIEANEDVDFYKFSVPAGTALSFHVRCARLEDKIHDLQTHADPLIALRNAGGTHPGPGRQLLLRRSAADAIASTRTATTTWKSATCAIRGTSTGTTASRSATSRS